MQYIFDEENFINNLKNDVETIFKDDSTLNVIGNEVNVITDINRNSTSFPCIFIRVLDSPTAEKYSTVEEGQNFSNLIIEFDCYSKEFNNYSRDKAVIFLTKKLIQGLVEKYPLLLLRFNQFMPNIDAQTARKIIRFSCTINNKTNFIYNN